MPKYYLKEEKVSIHKKINNNFVKIKDIFSNTKENRTYLDILEHDKKNLCYKVRCYVPLLGGSKEIIEGYISSIFDLIGIEGIEELYDGRFNLN